MKIMTSFSKLGNTLCHVDDCSCFVDGTCIISANFDDDRCKAARIVPTRVLRKNVEKRFDKNDCYMLTVGTSSKGAQIKWRSSDGQWFIKEQFYFQARYWNDDVVECLASDIMKQLGIFCVEQHLGTIGGLGCSYSKWWGSKTFISFGKLDRENKLAKYKDPLDKMYYAEEVLSKRIGDEAKQYLADLILIDFIIGNEDRHAYNFGIWFDESKIKFELAPIFDCGLSLFEHDSFYAGKTLNQVLSKMSQKPFGGRQVLLKHFANAGLLRRGKFSIPEELIPNDLARQYLKWSKEYLSEL